MIQVGIDEVGRGAWAGPIVMAAVCFPEKITQKDFKGVLIRDSKLLNPAQRQRASQAIQENSLFEFEYISHREIDEYGLQRAMIGGLRRLTDAITTKIHPRTYKIWIDGKRMCDLAYNHEYVIKGDIIMPIISAASIIAKVERDAYMHSLAEKFPNYGFERHVGYGTAMHQSALKKYGPCEYHRTSFRPIRGILNK